MVAGEVGIIRLIVLQFTDINLPKLNWQDIKGTDTPRPIGRGF